VYQWKYLITFFFFRKKCFWITRQNAMAEKKQEVHWDKLKLQKRLWYYHPQRRKNQQLEITIFIASRHEKVFKERGFFCPYFLFQSLCTQEIKLKLYFFYLSFCVLFRNLNFNRNKIFYICCYVRFDSKHTQIILQAVARFWLTPVFIPRENY
jgi:hypothetical protein